MTYIQNIYHLKYLKSLPKRTKIPWQMLYPNANPKILDLLENMLTFNPEKRYTVKECLQHPYFEDLYQFEDLIECEQAFDMEWYNFEPTKEILQKMIYKESLYYHSD